MRQTAREAGNCDSAPNARSWQSDPAAGKQGGFRTASVFAKPFDDVCEVMGLKKKITARAMRRPFQDLAREANIDGVVKRSICGQATEKMSELYSTVRH